MASSLALLAALAAVICGTFAVEFGWQPQKELTFTVQGQDVAGLPVLKPQYAGFRYYGELRVQTHSSRVLLLKFFNMSYSKIHEDLPHGWWNGPEAPLRNKSKQLPITTSTIVVKLSRSMSPELVLQSGLDDWQVNFIKGIVSHLIVYLNGNSPAGHFFNKLTSSQASDVYSVFEESVSGRCEVMYEITPLPKQLGPNNQELCDSESQLWEITKTRNFSNCQVLSEDHAHVPKFDCQPGGSNCGRIWSRASLNQMVGCGDMNSLVVLSSVSSSVKNVQLQLKNSTQAVVNSNLNITLTSILDLKSKFNAPQDKQIIRTLLYSYSATLKDFSSQKCQDSFNNAQNVVDNDDDNDYNDGDESHKHIDPSKQMNPTKDEEEDINSMESSKPGFRRRRAIRYNKYRSSSNELKSNSGSDEQQTPGQNSIHSSGKGASKKRGLKNKYDKGYRTENNQFVSEEKYDSARRGLNKYHQSEESNEQFDEDFNNQHSEEMDLEEHWKIASKDTKEVPPHQPFDLFALAHRNSQDLSCLNSKLRQIIGDIANDLKEINALPEKSTMEKLSIAVDICRSLPFDQLSAISEEVFEVHNGASNTMKSDERKVFRDVIAMCGSHPALMIVKGWIERHQVEGEEAAQIVSSLPSHIVSPNKYFIQDFFDMVQQITEGEDEQLLVTAVLSFSNLVRSACVNQKSRLHRYSSINKPVCDEAYVARYVEWLSHKISSDAPLRPAYIRAIGNVGSPHVIQILKSIAVNPKYSSYYRTSAIFAMKYQALKNNPEMAPLLLSLYHNYSMPASARIASAALLVYCNPGLAIWQRLAISTWYEPSSAVAQFVSSSLRNIANIKDTLYGQMAKASALVRPLARPSKITPNQPFDLMTSWLSSDLEKIVFEQLSWMRFNDFSNLYYRHTSRYSGYSRANIEASVSVSNPDDLWSALQELITSDEDLSNNSPDLGASHTLADIQNMLNLEPRPMPSLQGELQFNVNNLMERMFLINKNSIQSLVKEGHKMVSEVLREGKKISYQKADMDGFHISTTTEMGFPVEFSVRTPWMIRAKTEINTTMEGLGLEAAFMYSAQMLSSLSVMSPWDKIAHMAGAYATNFVQLPPLQLVFSIDSASDSIKIKTNSIDQHRLLYFNMQPFTSQRKIKVLQPVLLSPDTMNVKLGESIQVPISGMGRFLNTVYSTERPKYFSAWDLLKQTRGVVGFPMVFVNMESRSFETVMNQLHPLTMNFSMSTASKSLGVLEYDSPKDTFMSRILSSLEKITSLGKSPVMAAFRLFGGLFGGGEETSSTGKTSGNKTDSSHSNRGNPLENTAGGKDNDGTSGSKNQPEDQTSTVRRKVGKSTLTSQVYTTTYESAVGSFNASEIYPFARIIPGGPVNYLLDHVLSKINSGNAIVYAFDIKSEAPERPIQINAYATYASTYSGRVNRLGLFVMKDQTQVKITAVHEEPSDISFDLNRRVTEDLKHNLFLDFIQATSNEDTKVFMKAKLGVSRSELVELRSSPRLRACSMGDAAIGFECQRLRAQTQQISFGNITINYNDDAKYLERMIVKYVNAAKVMIPGTREKSGEGYNTITALLNVDQKTRSVDVLVITPANSLKVHRLPLYELPIPTVAEWATQPDMVQEYCGISPKRFRTFDGGESLYDLKDGWHLVLHDRTRKYGLSVLAQSSNNGTLKVEVNTDDQAVVRVEEGPKVYINDELQPLDNSHPVMVVRDGQGQVVMHTTYTPDSTLRIQLPRQHLNLKYTTSSLILRAGSALQGRLCGICGSFSNTGAEQYLTARGKSARNSTEYAASFLLGGSSSSKSNSGE